MIINTLTRVLKIFTFLKLNFHFLIKNANMNFLNDPFEQSVGWPIRSGVFDKLLDFCSLYLKSLLWHFWIYENRNNLYLYMLRIYVFRQRINNRLCLYTSQKIAKWSLLKLKWKGDNLQILISLEMLNYTESYWNLSFFPILNELLYRMTNLKF